MRTATLATVEAKNDRLDTRFAHQCREPLDGAGSLDARIGDEDRATDAQLLQALANASSGAEPVEEPGRALERVNAVPGHLA